MPEGLRRNRHDWGHREHDRAQRHDVGNTAHVGLAPGNVGLPYASVSVFRSQFEFRRSPRKLEGGLDDGVDEGAVDGENEGAAVGGATGAMEGERDGDVVGA